MMSALQADAAAFADVAVTPEVLIVSHSAKLAGAELILLDLASGFSRGSSVFVFEHGPLCHALVERGLPVVVSRRANSFARVKRDRSLLRALPQLGMLAAVTVEIARAARRHRILYANSQKAFVLAAPASVLARRPLIWHLHDILSSDHFAAAQRRLVVSLANAVAARVIVPSSAVADAFVSSGGKASLTQVVPNGVDMAPNVLSKSELRAALGLPGGFLFGVFSRLAPWKGQHVAIEALAQLPAARCVVAGAALFGEDAYAQALRDLAARLGVADRVLFVGHRNDVPSLMRAMDAIVHPSVSPEPFGRTLIEGMFCRVPVIAARDGAAPEILDEGRAGLLVPPGDATALAAALRGVMAPPGMSGEMIDAAEHRARQLYTGTRMVAALRAVVGDLAAGRP